MLHRTLAVLALMLCASSAPAAEDPAAAREHYRRATTLYDLLRYREAIKEFEAAYEAKPDPAFLYNMAQAYRLAGEYDQAVGAYRSFLRRMPKAPNRDEVQAHIAALQKLLDDERLTRQRDPSGTLRPAPWRGGPNPDEPTHPATGTPAADRGSPRPAAGSPPPATGSPPPASPPGAEAGSPVLLAPVEGPASAPAPPPSESPAERSPPRPGFVKRVTGIALLGAGAVGLALGAVLAAQAAAASDQLSHPGAGDTFDPSIEERYQTNRSASAALFVVGGALAIGGTTLFLLGWREGRAAVAIAPTLGPGRAGASLSLSY